MKELTPKQIVRELNKYIKSTSIEKKIRNNERPSDHVPLIADFEF